MGRAVLPGPCRPLLFFLCLFAPLLLSKSQIRAVEPPAPAASGVADVAPNARELHSVESVLDFDIVPLPPLDPIPPAVVACSVYVHTQIESPTFRLEVDWDSSAVSLFYGSPEVNGSIVDTNGFLYGFLVQDQEYHWASFTAVIEMEPGVFRGGGADFIIDLGSPSEPPVGGEATDDSLRLFDVE
jgi:hypothetical protein